MSVLNRVFVSQVDRLREAFECFHNFNVSRKPIDSVKFIAGEPLHGFMLDQFDFALRDARQEAVHREVKVRVVVVDRRHELVG